MRHSKLMQRSKCCSTPHLLFYNRIQWRIGQFICPKQFIFQQFLARDDLCWETPCASTAYWWLYANTSVVLAIWTLAERCKLSYSTITAQTLPGSFLNLIFFWGDFSRKSKKKKKKIHFTEHILTVSSQRIFFPAWLWTEKPPRVAKGLH